MLKIIFPSVVLELQKADINKAVRASGRLVQQEAKALIDSSQGGPGNPPQNRTGALASSIRLNMKKGAVRVTATVPYALALEAGAEGGGGKKGNRNKRGVASTIRKMAPRPYLSVALDTKSDEISRRIVQAVEQGIKFKETT